MNTGNEQECMFYKAEHGMIKDVNKRIPDFNKEYYSNSYGKFKFLELYSDPNIDHKMCKIKFIDTGTIVNVTLSNAYRGAVKDPYRPIIYGVACQGNASTKCKAYSIWKDMIRRCYDTNSKEYLQYGFKGVKVCNRWLCFEYFAYDLPNIPGYNLWLLNHDKYEMDKDVLQMTVPEYLKVYSPLTVQFIDKSLNRKYATLYQKINHEDNYYSKYIGVHNRNDKYNVRININGVRRSFGVYETEIAAANLYNNLSKIYYGDNAILNQVPKMSNDDILSQRITKQEMCKIIH